MNAIEARLSSHLHGNWKEELSEIRKEMVHSRSVGEEKQLKLRTDIEDLKREMKKGMN